MLDAYERISEELNQAPWFGRTPDLTRMDALLDELGLPQANTKKEFNKQAFLVLHRKVLC